jgi:hypothetical protein
VMEQFVIVLYCVVSKHRMLLCDDQLDIVMMTVFSVVYSVFFVVLWHLL